MGQSERLDEEQLRKLLELAQSEASPEDSQALNEAERFAISVGIVAGETRVPPFVIWAKYKEWTNKPMSRKHFFRQFSKLFPRVRWGEGKFYFLDPAPFDLSQEAIFALREQIRDEKRNERRKKENQERQS